MLTFIGSHLQPTVDLRHRHPANHHGRFNDDDGMVSCKLLFCMLTVIKYDQRW